MAQLQTREPARHTADKPDIPALIEQAFAILSGTPEPHTETDVVSRLRQIKELLQGVQIPAHERDGLGGSLIVFALDEPGYSEAATELLKEIMVALAPDRHDGPLHDAQGRIIDRFPPLPPLTEEELQYLAEYDAQFANEAGA
jgi:hypothetical protein